MERTISAMTTFFIATSPFHFDACPVNVLQRMFGSTIAIVRQSTPLLDTSCRAIRKDWQRDCFPFLSGGPPRPSGH